MHRTLFIGQAPPLRTYERPFGGSKLYVWLESVGLGLDFVDQYASFGALVDFFPGSKHGSHVAPSPEQILAGREQLQKLLVEFQPGIVVPIGKLSIQEALGREVNLEQVIGERFEADPYGLLGKVIPIIPLPHPSGASRWIWQGNHGELVKRALGALEREVKN
jgi:uracil-DNA glycosylase